MIRWLRERKRLLNLLLPLAGAGAVLLSWICSDGCAAVAGTLAGIDLKIVGLIYLALFAACTLLSWHGAGFALLSMGMGAEVFLLGRQLATGKYCSFCLAFAAVVALLFLINVERERIRSLLAAAGGGFVLLLLSFSAAVVPSYGAAAGAVPAFGRGPVEVRLYTDYFCGPCSRLEPELAGRLGELVAGGKITLTLIDTPLHKQTPMYARYFLRLVQGQGDFAEVLRRRALLFEAAGRKLDSPEKLEAFLRQHDLTPGESDPQPALRQFEEYLRQDEITATPTMVVRQDGGRQVRRGKSAIIEAIAAIR